MSFCSLDIFAVIINLFKLGMSIPNYMLLNNSYQLP